MKTLRLIFSILLITLFSGCSSSPSKQLPEKAVTSPPIVTVTPVDNTLSDLEQKRMQAKSQRDWQVFLTLTEQLLPFLQPEQQLELLQTTYQELKQISPSFWPQRNSIHPAWEALASSFELPKTFRLAWLIDSATIYEDHRPTQQLVSHFEQAKKARKSKRIAIMLPYDERTQSLSNQIRAGILAAYWQTSQQDQILFFNIEDYPSPIEAYYATQRAEADWVIGPYDRESIDQLSTIADERFIFLNQAPNAPKSWQIQFQNPQAIDQLITQIQHSGVRNLGVLYPNQSNHANSITNINALWHQNPQARLISLGFEQNQRNLRNEIGQALQSNQSQARANFLQRTIGTNLTFFPRHRHDLDTLIILGDQEYIANIQPQMDYFQVKLPIYATDRLMPTQFIAEMTQPDLKNIRFLSYPAALTPELVKTPLEALGWDSFLITQYHQALNDGLALNGATGQLRKPTNKLLNRQLALLKFNQRGQLHPDPSNRISPPFTNYTGQIAPIAPQTRQAQHQELLELITQPRLEIMP